MHRQFTFVPLHLRKKASVPGKEAKWVRQLCAGDAAVWAQLVDHWSPRLYNYVFYNVAVEAEAQKLLNSIFAELVQRVVGSLQIPNLTILIFSIAYQQVLHYRQQNPLSTLPKDSPSVSSDAQTTAQGSQFLQIFHRFPPEIQQILLLYYLCGVPLLEISQIVGQSEDALTKILHRAKYYLSA